MKTRILIYILLSLPLISLGDDFDEVEQNPLVENREYADYIELDTLYKNDYRSDKYDYTEKIKEPEPEKEPVEERSPSSFSFNFGTLAKIIFYAFLALAGILVIYLIVKGIQDMGFAKNGKTVTPTSSDIGEKDLDPEEVLDSDNLHSLIARAKQEGNYTLAVRYYFLLYLEQLEQNKHITYHRDKTNQDYVAELKDDKLVADFVKLSYPFEYVWYGKKPLTAQTFETLEKIFQSKLRTT